MYDRFVIRRNENLVNQAARTNRIIASLFPSNVRDRLLADEVEKQAESGAQTRLKDFLANDGPSVGDMTLQEDETYKTRPIADLFPEATVLFQDVSPVVTGRKGRVQVNLIISPLSLSLFRSRVSQRGPRREVGFTLLRCRPFLVCQLLLLTFPFSCAQNLIKSLLCSKQFIEHSTSKLTGLVGRLCVSLPMQRLTICDSLPKDCKDPQSLQGGDYRRLLCRV